jgi:hypothetical protein
MKIKSPRFKGSKTGGQASIYASRLPLREEKRETIHHRLWVRPTVIAKVPIRRNSFITVLMS